MTDRSATKDLAIERLSLLLAEVIAEAIRRHGRAGSAVMTVMACISSVPREKRTGMGFSFPAYQNFEGGVSR